ncbi:MAG: hypothetical protein P4M13_01000 [Alphaproteobacteria bacterium]|nr:hypothetical protein [Alphaproteobacteria bacterium]
MRRALLAVIVLALGLTAAMPAYAWRGGGGWGWGLGTGLALGIGLGSVCCGGGYYSYYAPDYDYPTYYVSPPTVVYQTPAPVYVAPQTVTIAQPVSVTPTSQTFIDSAGRTCRDFQSVIDGAPVSGTACLQPDGSWRTTGR